MNIKRQLSVALLVGGSLGLGSGLVGCKSPMGGLAFWNKDDTSLAGSSPDVGRQKYEGLAKEYGSSSGGSRVALGGQAPAADDGFLASSWNKTTAAVSSAFTMKPRDETDDPTSLTSKPGKIGAEPYIAAARLMENQNKLPEAQAQYERALQAAPNDLTALVSLARLHDRRGNAQPAVELYQRALKAHPKTALVHNDLGLCFARQQQWPQATQSLNNAIALQPTNPKYRNNLATVMVEMGRPDEALRQLTAVNPAAVAHYNLAYLLQQKGQQEQAISHLREAVAKDETLGPAHEMLAALTGTAANTAQPEARIAAQPVSTPIYQPAQPAPQTPGNTYSISDDIGPIQQNSPSEGGSVYGSQADALPAPVIGIEPLPPIEE